MSLTRRLDKLHRLRATLRVAAVVTNGGVPLPHSGLFKSPEQLVGEPPCPNCGRGMWLYRIEPTHTPGHDQRTFSCSECAQQKTVFVKYE